MSAVPDVGKAAATTGSTALQTIFNWAALVVYLVLIIGAVLYIRDSDVSWIGFLWFILLIGFVGTMLALPTNLYENIKDSSPSFAIIVSNMPIWDYMLSNSILFGLGFLLATGIALVTKDSGTSKFG